MISQNAQRVFINKRVSNFLARKHILMKTPLLKTAKTTIINWRIPLVLGIFNFILAYSLKRI